MMSLVVHWVQVHELQPMQESPPTIRNVSSKYRFVCLAMGLGKSVAEITKKDTLVIKLTSILLSKN